MSAGTFTLSYPARTQLSLLSPAERAAFHALFSGDPREKPGMTQTTKDGRFVSRIGGKRVLWQLVSGERPEILSIVDQSYTATAG